MKIAIENRDIVRYMRKHFIMNFEIADTMGISVEEFELLLTEPLERQEKADIAQIVDDLFRIQYLERRDGWYSEVYEYQKEKYASWLSAHNCLKDGPKYTGYNRNWDAYNGCYYVD